MNVVCIPEQEALSDVREASLNEQENNTPNGIKFSGYGKDLQRETCPASRLCHNYFVGISNLLFEQPTKPRGNEILY